MIVGVYALLFCGGDILEVCWTEGLLAVQSLGNQDDVGLHVACLCPSLSLSFILENQGYCIVHNEPQISIRAYNKATYSRIIC